MSASKIQVKATAARPAPQSATESVATGAAAGTATLHPTIQRAVQMAERGDCEGALQLLRSHGQHPETQNAIGVCLMRLGKTQEATKLYRTLVLAPGCTWMRPELPTRYKTNFATALLLAGHPAGCLEMLDELKDQPTPMEAKLRAAIRQWEAGLSLWRWLDWRLCRVEPSKMQVELDFPPGEFVDPPASDRSR